MEGLIFPTRPHRFGEKCRTEPPLHASFPDHEKVVQPDGQTAVFFWRPDETGWKFSHWTAHGFNYPVQEELAQRVTAHEIPVESMERYPQPEPGAVGPGETLHAYRYGGCLSMRTGWYITPDGEPTKVLKHKLVAMS